MIYSEAMKRHRLSSADCAWLHMERPTNLMTITGLLRFDGVPEFPIDRLLAHERFRSRVVESPWGPCWELDRGFDISQHLLEVQVPDEGALMQLAGQLMSTPLDHSRPLWQVHLVRLASGSAVVIRLHHALGDGVAMMHVLSTLADATGARLVPRAPSRPTPGIQKVAGAARELAKVLLTPEPSTSLKGSLGQSKLAVVSQGLSVERVKQVGHCMGATVNDVLLACLAGALRRYLGAVASGLRLRVVMPVDLRRAGDERLGNRFGLVFVELPVGCSEPLTRLNECKRELDRLKSSAQPAALYAILQLAGRLPVWGEGVLVRIFGSRATAVATNVHGPDEPLVLGGQPLRSLMFWVPQAGRLGLGVSIISYAGEVRVGLAADSGLIPHPHLLLEAFQQAFEELSQAVN